MIFEDHFNISGLYFLGRLLCRGFLLTGDPVEKNFIFLGTETKCNFCSGCKDSMNPCPGRPAGKQSAQKGKKTMKHITTLKRNRDFSRLYNKGKSYVAPSVVVYVLRNRVNRTRIGITTSKKVGNAVERNRARRVIREAYRQLSLQVRPGVDIVMVARKKTLQVKSTEVHAALVRLFGEANLLMEARARADVERGFNKRDKTLSNGGLADETAQVPILPKLL